MAIFDVDETGVVAPSLDEALALFRQDFQRLFGDDLVLDAQTPQGQIVGILAIVAVLIGEALVKIGNGTDADNAVGTQLDRLWSLLDILRQQASRSRLTATLTGVAGSGVPAGSRAKTTAGAEFETLAAVTLEPTPGVTVTMQAVQSGAVEAAAGTLTQIVTVVSGWETVTNGEAAVLGLARQDDATFRASAQTRTARASIGPLSALYGALEEALAGKTNAVENRTNGQDVQQGWTLEGHHILVVAEHGTTMDIERAVENHRGQGAGTMTAIRGAAPNDTMLDAVNNGTVTWNGTGYTGLDLTSSGTGALKAAALTTLLAGDAKPPTVAFIDGVYVAQFPWIPGEDPVFGTGTVEEAFGLDADAATASPGPFVRPRQRALTIAATVERFQGFPADGLNQMRAAPVEVVVSYAIGQQAWSNDILRALEGVPGTRVTALTVQHDSTDVSGVEVALDNLWTVQASDVAITIA